eukprot:TRINITY_DN17768_c0_g1_i1.p1 TRINITY_DN17768_c0_g1~~TRINITY_DN17768_c0_g1_i1.p1  ORF type:complete len:172 (+),score=47.92 TRINITY_DN17768_c0_g1_i1:144-659(+)
MSKRERKEEEKLEGEVEDVEKDTDDKRKKRKVENNDEPLITKGVEEVFSQYPDDVQEMMRKIRTIIFRVARELDEIGELEETLKWGQPSWLPKKAKVGSAVRIAKEKSTPGDFAVLFKCTSKLVETFRERFSDSTLRFQDNRAIIFNAGDEIPPELAECIRLTLTYHLWKK